MSEHERKEMSRIEEALEKAIRLRGGNGSSEAVRKPPFTAPPIYAQPQEEMITIENPLLVTVNDPHSPIAEEYRKLKSILVKFTKQEQFNNTLMVTSSVGCEGKSITALNLAISLAQEFDHTVLLVDADLRKPSLHGYLGLEPKLGLAECLQEGIDIGDALIKTGIGRLTLLPGGTPLRNPVELFSSQKMKEFVAEIKSRYPDRFIIIDTPPVLPFAETRSLGALVDGVVFVIREGHATMENIGEAVNSLDRSKLLGLVYNEATVQSLNGRYHYYYHGYGYDKETKDQGPGTRDQGQGTGNILTRLFKRGRVEG